MIKVLCFGVTARTVRVNGKESVAFEPEKEELGEISVKVEKSKVVLLSGFEGEIPDLVLYSCLRHWKLFKLILEKERNVDYKNVKFVGIDEFFSLENYIAKVPYFKSPFNEKTLNFDVNRIKEDDKKAFEETSQFFNIKYRCVKKSKSIDSVKIFNHIYSK